MIEYVKAIKGKHKVHIKYPNAKNDITLCRYCTKFTKSDEKEFNKNPCSRCLQLKKDYDNAKIDLW